MELELQRYLRNGGTTADLAATRGINVYRHPTLPLVGFKYGPLSFPKTDSIIRDCRGVVLEDGTWDVVGRTFRRFFNATENPASFAAFRWDDFTATTKEDGSLILVYHYAGAWHVNTSGSFGRGLCATSGKSWAELFWRTARVDRDLLDPGLTYVFEMWTPHNSVVRIYDWPSAFLLTVFERGGREQSVAEADGWATRLAVPRPMHHHFASLDEITAYLSDLSERDRTFEGIVVRDCLGQRLKIKSEAYVALHHLADKASLAPRSLVGLVLNGEVDEVLAYLPQIEPHIAEVSGKMDAGYAQLLKVWREAWRIEAQKDFAIAIARRTPFAPVLFQLRQRHGKDQTEALLRAAWLQSTDLIVKHLF